MDLLCIPSILIFVLLSWWQRSRGWCEFRASCLTCIPLHTHFLMGSWKHWNVWAPPFSILYDSWDNRQSLALPPFHWFLITSSFHSIPGNFTMLEILLHILLNRGSAMFTKSQTLTIISVVSHTGGRWGHFCCQGSLQWVLRLEDEERYLS